MSILKATQYGEEFYYLVAYVSPALLALPPVRNLALQRRWIRTFILFHLIVLISFFKASLGLLFENFLLPLSLIDLHRNQ